MVIETFLAPELMTTVRPAMKIDSRGRVRFAFQNFRVTVSRDKTFASSNVFTANVTFHSRFAGIERSEGSPPLSIIESPEFISKMHRAYKTLGLLR